LPSGYLKRPEGEVCGHQGEAYLYNIGYAKGVFGNVWSDPAPGCWKGFDLSYKCGNGSVFKTVSMHPNKLDTSNQPVVLDCTSVSNTCKCYLIIQDNGDLCIYAGNDPKNTETLLFSHSSTSNKLPNIMYSASKGKTGVNYILSGSGLMSNEWIGSNDGSTRLLMGSDGNLKLINNIAGTSLCNIQPDKTYAGGTWANAVYKITSSLPDGILGSFGYIDGTGSLKKYPSNLLEGSNTYVKNANYINNGDVISKSYNSTSDSCATSCSSTKGCLGYNFISDGSNACVLNSTIGSKSPNNTSTFYLRNMQLNKTNVDASCLGASVENINTTKWTEYPKGSDMSSDNKCNINLDVNVASPPDLDKIVNTVDTTTKNFKTKNKSIYNDISKNNLKNAKNLFEYDTISKNNTNAKNIHTSQNLDIIVGDTKLVATMYNYQLYIWIFLIVLIILILFRRLS